MKKPIITTLLILSFLIIQSKYSFSQPKDTLKLQQFQIELENVEKLRSNRKLPQALSLVDSVLKTFPTDTIHKIYARGLHLKAIIYNEMTFYKKGLQLLENAIKISEKIPDALSLQAMLEREYITLPSTSKVDKRVLHYGKRAINHYKQLNDYVNLALTYSDLAAYFGNNHQHELGFYYSDLAKEYFEKATNPSNESIVELEKKLAELYSGFDQSIALKHRKNIYDINKSINPKNPETAWTAAQLGWTYMVNQNYDSAKTYLQQGLNILKNYYPDESPTLAHVFLALGEIYIYLNQPDSANYYLDKTKRNYESVSPNYYWLNSVYQMYAKLEEKQNNYIKAIQHLHNALYYTIDSFPKNNDIFTNPPLEKCKSHEVTKHVLIKKTLLFKKQFEKTKEQKYLRASIKFGLLTNDFLLHHSYDPTLTENQLNKYLYITLEGAMASNIQSLQLVKNNEYKPKLIKQVYDGLSKAKAFLLQSDLNRINTYKSDTANQIFAQIHNTKNTIRELEYKIKNTTDENTLRAQKEKLAALYLSVFLNKKELDKYSNNANITISKKNIEIFNAAKWLSKDEVIIDYFYNDSILAAFIVNKNGIDFHTQIIDGDFIEKTNNYYRHLKTSSTSLEKSAEYLSEYLIHPIEKYIDQQKELIIIPYGKLHQIPFEPLMIKGNGKMVIENYAISYNYSSNLIKKSNKRRNSKLTAFAPGFMKDNQAQVNTTIAVRTDSLFYRDPIQRKTGTYLAPLPYSTKEVAEVGKLFKKLNANITVFKDQKATESAFKNYLNDSGIIHIATHGYTSLSKPELSGLFFSNSESQSDGYLHMHELYNQTTNAELVVLSACKSGAGISIQNEGALALPRGFLAIGADNILASLWKIHDKKTMELMILFYQNVINNGSTFKQALKDAKVECIRRGFLPMDWAGFILIGN
jgi:CHAT domain-containing protein